MNGQRRIRVRGNTRDGYQVVKGAKARPISPVFTSRVGADAWLAGQRADRDRALIAANRIGRAA